MEIPDLQCDVCKKYFKYETDYWDHFEGKCRHRK